MTSIWPPSLLWNNIKAKHQIYSGKINTKITYFILYNVNLNFYYLSWVHTFFTWQFVTHLFASSLWLWFILIITDNFDRKVWIRLNSCQLLNWSTQLDNTKLGQPITKQRLILFRLFGCKKVALAIKENIKILKQNMVRSECLNNFWSHICINFTACPLFQ